jgi:dephospho-CoA kinase
MRRVLQRVVCICGPPAAGKSTAAALIGERSAVAIIETGRVVAQLLGRRPVHEMSARDQSRFRKDALTLVNAPAPTPLVRALRRRIRRAEHPVVLVGVRHVSTLAGLRGSRSFRLRVVFIDAPARVCARRYALRQGVSQARYRTVLNAATEAEHAQIKATADDLVPNAVDDLGALKRRLLSVARWLMKAG